MANSSADRNLLFGLLALQNGLIDQSALVVAFHAWTRDKTRPIADHLVNKGDLDQEQRELLDGLVSQHIKKHGGNPETSLAAVSAGRMTRESLAQLADPDVDATLNRVGSGSTAKGIDEADANRTATYGVGAPTSDGQRFRVLRPHAKGGLGAVFVALDVELHREVALKQILDPKADDQVVRARFLLEAEITGGLEHPGIVPVYGLGTYENGRPYYAMRFIRGDTLKEACDRFHADPSLIKNPGGRSLELHKLLRRFLDVCDAIYYAHGRGIIHRDLKPSNVVLGKHGETLVVDWGLAKIVGRSEPAAAGDERTLVLSSASGSAETLPGSALGTPAYMSPEQAMGDLDRVGPSSDVYSLGAMLYYLLTGKPPFEGDVGQVLQAVQKGEFRPVRSVSGWIDPALAAICQKAMARQPEQRYETARALATDVERWMADEPVTAYREPLRRRISRWERRHKPFVYGSVTVLIVAAVGLAVTAAVAREEKRATDVARHLAELKAVEADENFRKAFEAFFEYCSRVSDQQLNRFPGLEGVRRDLTAKAVTGFRDFLKAKPDDPILLTRASRAFRDAAIVRSLIGDLQETKDLYLEAITTIEHLIGLKTRAPQPVDRFTLAKTLGDFASFLRENGRDEEAVTYRARAQTLVDGLVSERIDDLQFIYLFTALALNQVEGWIAYDDGVAAVEAGDYTRARRSFNRAIDLLGPVARLPGVWLWHPLRMAQAHRGLGTVAHAERNTKEADRQFTEALVLIREVIKANPTDSSPRYVLSFTLATNGRRLMSDPSRGPEADAAFAEAIELLTKLAQEYPATTWYRNDLAQLLVSQAIRQAGAGGDELAEKNLSEALRLYAELSPTASFDMTYAGHVGRAKMALGQFRFHQGRAADGRVLLDEGITHLERACQFRPKSVIERTSLAEAREVRRRLIPDARD